MLFIDYGLEGGYGPEGKLHTGKKNHMTVNIQNSSDCTLSRVASLVCDDRFGILSPGLVWCAKYLYVFVRAVFPAYSKI